MDHDPNSAALREARRHQKLGNCSDICLICGQPALKIVSVKFAEAHGIPRSLIEGHHVVGVRRNSQLMVPLCLTHHWILTVKLINENIHMQAERDDNEFVAQCLTMLAIFLEILSPALRDWAERLRERSK